MSENRQIVLVERPRYKIPTHNCFKIKKKAVPKPGDNELLIRTLYLSLDPYLGSRMQRVSSQAEPVPLGDVMIGATVGVVEESNHPAHKVGELVSGFWGWQDYAISNGSRLEKVKSDLEREHPSYSLGALSRTTGLGAYIGVNEVAKPRSGETVVIGTATGGLGQLIVQMAKNQGARVVGIAGGREKCDFAVRELGADACVSHTSKKFKEELRDACPEGVDIYFETVGGKDMEAVMPLMNLHSRMPVFSVLALYTAKSLPKGPDRTMLFLHHIMTRRMEVTGVVSNDYYQSHFADFQREMSSWIRDGQIKVFEDIVDGLENTPQTFQDMFQTSKHKGKLLIKVSDL